MLNSSYHLFCKGFLVGIYLGESGHESNFSYNAAIEPMCVQPQIFEIASSG